LFLSGGAHTERPRVKGWYEDDGDRRDANPSKVNELHALAFTNKHSKHLRMAEKHLRTLSKKDTEHARKFQQTMKKVYSDLDLRKEESREMQLNDILEVGERAAKRQSA